LVTPVPLSPLLLLCCAYGGGSIKISLQAMPYRVKHVHGHFIKGTAKNWRLHTTTTAVVFLQGIVKTTTTVVVFLRSIR
jgi:hypothetical protein